jgi:hypothetical protein
MVMADQPDKIATLINKKQEFSVLIHSLPSVTQFVDTLNHSLKICKGSAVLSDRQRTWLRTVLVGIVMTGTLNWAAFERRSLKTFKQGCLRWMFYQAKIAWPLLLRASVGALLRHYLITRGVLAIDDTDKQHSKNTTKIASVHKIKDKKTGGYFNGQELIFMVLVTDWITFPVGFRWYQPDPKQRAWRKENKRLKREGLPRNERPSQPPSDPNYPTKQALALAMVQDFTDWFPGITVTATLGSSE